MNMVASGFEQILVCFVLKWKETCLDWHVFMCCSSSCISCKIHRSKHKELPLTCPVYVLCTNDDTKVHGFHLVNPIKTSCQVRMIQQPVCCDGLVLDLLVPRVPTLQHQSSPVYCCAGFHVSSTCPCGIYFSGSLVSFTSQEDGAQPWSTFLPHVQCFWG